MTKPTLRWTSTSVVLVLFTFLGSLEALSVYLRDVQLGRPTSWGAVLTSTWPSWSLQMALAWPVARLSQWARIGPGTWRRSLPIHAIGAVLFLMITVLGTVLIFRQLGQIGGQPVRVVFVRSMLAFLSEQVGVYVVMVGAVHALHYLRESEQRERERARLAVSLMETRLSVLRSQLSPHFFFNTLNAISTLSLQGRPDQVGEMVGALGELMRASLDDQLPHQVPLRRELELLDLYLDIQRLRFQDWLRIEKRIAPAACDVLVPSLILQPLVENAIEHGGADTDGLHRVHIHCDLDQNALRIEIANPAPDTAPESNVRAGGGVGLRNTRERLAQLYPGEHEFRFGLVAGHGFLTSVRIPVRHEAMAPAVTRGMA